MDMQTIEEMPPEAEEVPRIATQRVIELIEEDPLPPFSVSIRRRSEFSFRRVFWTLLVVGVLFFGAFVVLMAPLVGC
jgi:hypothetical protein